MARHSAVDILQFRPQSRFVYMKWLDHDDAGYPEPSQSIYPKLGKHDFEFAVLDGESELLAGPLENTFVPLDGSQKRVQSFDPLVLLTGLGPAMGRALQTDAIFVLH